MWVDGLPSALLLKLLHPAQSLGFPPGHLLLLLLVELRVEVTITVEEVTITMGVA